MDSKVVDMTLSFDYIGHALKYDLPAILARSFFKAKQSLNTKQGFKFYSTIQLWITKKNEDGEETGGLLKTHVFLAIFEVIRILNGWILFTRKYTIFFKVETPLT